MSHLRRIAKFFLVVAPLLAVFIMLQSPQQIQTVEAQADPRATTGEWGTAMNWPLVAVHTAIMPDGQILMWDAWEVGRAPSARLWNPTTGTFTSVPNLTSGLFCAGQSMLADGRQFVVGGHVASAKGINHTNIFNPFTNTWSRVADMAYARWYPATNILGDGRVITLGGEIDPGIFADVPEIYDPATNTWTALPGAALPVGNYPNTYPMPNGQIFLLRAGDGTTRALNIDTQTWTTLAQSPLQNFSSVMYRPGKVMMAGGTNDIGKTTAVIDLNAGSPNWRISQPMAFNRFQHTLVAMPDGQVLAVGGSSILSLVSTTGVKQAEMWNADTEIWTTLSSMRDNRMYHSDALLLPDGRVLVMGGGRLAPAIDYQTAEIFSPPYLFKGARPTITSAPSAASYGANMAVTTSDADISTVAMVRFSSSTHTMNTDQRYIPVSFTRNGDTLNVQAPTNANDAPPGYYMLFILNSDGVPSVAKTVHLTGTSLPPTNQHPTPVIASPTPGQVITAGATGTASVSLSATGSSDSDGSITNYAWSWTGTSSGTATGSSVSRTFGVGSYSLSLTVTDDDGATATTTQTFTVQAASTNQPPTAVITAPTAAQVFTADGTGNASVSLNGTNSSDSDGSISSYGWSWSGTSSGTATGSLISRTFGVGSYNLILTVTDNQGAIGTATRSFTVQAAPNQPPTAVIATPTAGQVFIDDGTGTASVSLNATGSSDSDGSISSYGWSWTGASSGTATGSTVTRPFGVGSYTLTLTVTDNQGAINTANRSFSVQSSSGTVTLTLQPTGSSDDVNEDGTGFTTTGSLWVGNASSATNSWLGVRFTGVNIPPGAIISSARLEVFAISNQWINLGLNISGEAVDNSQFFTATTKPSQRLLTAATVPYNVNEQWTTNSWRNMGSVMPIIQELVNRPNWQSGNSLSLLLKGTLPPWSRKSIASFDNSATYAPRLVVTYIAGGPPPNQPPTAVISTPTAAQVFTADGTGNASVALSATGSSDIDGNIVTYTWSWTGTSSGTITGSSATPSFGIGSYTLTLTVTDDNGAIGTATRSFTVQPVPNQAPTAVIAAPTAGQVFTANATGNATVTLSATGSNDSDGSIVSYVWSWTGTNNGTVSNSPAIRSFAVGSYTLTLTVTDDDGAIGTATRSFTVQAAPPPNQLPTAVIASPTVDQVFTADGTGNATVTMNAAGSSDSDGSIVNYGWSWTGTSNGTASGGATAQSFGVGSYTLTLTVTDDDGENGTATRSFSVQPAPNQVPTAVIASPTSGQIFTADGTGNASVGLSATGSSDNDGSIVSYGWSWTGSSSGTATGSSATPSFAVGSYTLTLTVTDDDGAIGTATRSFTVQAAPPPNQPPTAVIASPTVDQVFTADGTGNATVTMNAAGSSDSDGNIASYGWSWTGSSTGTASGGATPQSFGVGSYTLTLTVTDDDGALDTETRSFTVQPAPNQVPTAVIASPTSGQVFTADGTGNASVGLSATGSSDNDGSIVSYGWSWTGTTSGTATGSSATPSFAVGSYTLTLTVTDDDGAIGTATRPFTVQAAPPPNQLPTAVIASPTVDQVFTADGTGNASVALSATGSIDNDGSIVSYGWSWTGTSSGTATGSSATPSFAVGSYTLTLTVTDDDGAIGTATRSFTVQAAPNLPPTFTPANQTSTVGNVINLSLASFASDPESLPLRFDLTAGSLPTGLTLQTNGMVTGTVGGAAAVHTPTIQVMDSVGQSVSASFTWTVQAAPSGPITLTLQPTTSTDDVNEDGTGFTSSGSLWVGNASSATNSWLGLRFTGVNIPQGATINSAQLEFFAIATQWITISMNVAGQAADNTPTFSASDKPSQRPLTTARLVYNQNEQWTLYNWYSLGNVANIVQEIVNRPNWQSGNSLSLLIKGTAAAWSRKSIASWDNNPIYAPRLVIQYTLNGVSMMSAMEIETPEQLNVPPPPAVAPPVAAFTSTLLVGDTPLNVQFSSTSTGADSYHWDFGDGTSSSETNPVKVYTIPGTYLVVLTVTNTGGTSTTQATIVLNAPPDAVIQPTPIETPPVVEEATLPPPEIPTDPPAEQTSEPSS